MAGRLADKMAIVTAAGQGIESRLCRALRGRGARTSSINDIRADAADGGRRGEITARPAAGRRPFVADVGAVGARAAR